MLLNILLHPINSYRYGIWSSYRNERVIFLPRDKDQTLTGLDGAPFRGFEGYGGLFVEKFQDGMKFTWGKMDYCCTDDGFSPFSVKMGHAGATPLLPELNEVSMICLKFPYLMSYNLSYFDPASDNMVCQMDISKNKESIQAGLVNNLGIECVQTGSLLTIKPKQYFDFQNSNVNDTTIRLGLSSSYQTMIKNKTLTIESSVNTEFNVYKNS